MSIEFTTPVGRMVWGGPDKPRTEDFDGNPLTVKTGPNKGQPTQRFEFGVAFPKGQEAQHGSNGWMYTEWGQNLLGAGQQFRNNEWQRDDFAWKVTDGDSQRPNKRGNIPCQREGFPGHWIVAFSTALNIKQYTLINTGGGDAKPLPDGQQIKAGYYVQVYCQVAPNENTSNPGIYVNPTMVCLVGFGEEIQQGPDVSQAGFGQGVQLPPGASTTPPGGFQAPANNGAAPPPAGGQPNMPPPANNGAAPPPADDWVQNQAANPLPPAGPTYVMTEKAGGYTRDQYINSGQGWTDEKLIAAGMMVQQ